MSDATPLSAPETLPLRTLLRTGDAVMLIVAILWMSEAMVRLNLGPVLTAAIYGWFCLRFLTVLPRLLEVLGANWILMLYPLVCLASSAWSDAPTLSATAALQLSFTLCLAIYTGAQFGIRRIAALLAAALGLALVASTINLAGIWTPVYSWEGGFLGIFTNKNGLGQRAALALLTAIFLAATVRGPGRRVVLALAVLAAALLLLSASATAILLGFATSGLWLTWALWTGYPGLRGVVLIAGATAALGGLALILGLGINPYAELLAAFGKNATLTGRTVLWDLALDKISSAPVLGSGYMAYWQAPQHAQEVRLIGLLYGATVSAFHSFPLEILVMTGIFGLSTMALFLGTAIARLLRLAPGAERAWALSATSLVIAFSLLGSSLYRPHEISLFLIAALAASAARPSRATTAPPGVRNT